MKLAMAQMRMGISTEENLSKTIRFVEQAGEAGADLIFSRRCSYPRSSPNTRKGTRSSGPCLSMGLRSRQSGTPAGNPISMPAPMYT